MVVPLVKWVQWFQWFSLGQEWPPGDAQEGLMAEAGAGAVLFGVVVEVKKPLTTCKNGLSSVTKRTNMFSALRTYSDFAHGFSVHPLVRGIYEFSVLKHSNCQNYSCFFAGIAFILGVLLCSFSFNLGGIPKVSA